MYGMITGDFNNDNHLDLLAVGNFYSGEVFSGQYDASIGWFLAGDGKGGFTPVDSRESGFFVQGDAKSLAELWSGNRRLILASINNGQLVVQESMDTGSGTYHAKPHDIGALVRFPDNSVQKFEFYLGSGYLSQSSRTLSIPANASSVIIVDDQGGKNEILALP
jgi:hypothetical protein